MKLYTAVMSLADKIRAKTQEAKERIEQQTQSRAEQALEEVEEFRRRTKRLATNRYERVTQLIEGAASEAKNELVFPSSWASDENFLEDSVVYAEVAQQLEKDGFKVRTQIEFKPGMDLEEETKLALSHKRRLILTISW